MEMNKKNAQKQRTFRECQKDKYFKYWTGSTLKNIKEAERENEKYKPAKNVQDVKNSRRWALIKGYFLKH